MIEFAFAEHIKSVTAITDIVGTRVFAERAPQNEAKPRIVYRLLAGSERFYHSEGASGLVEADIEVTMTASTYPKARDIYEALRNAIDGFQGTWVTTDIRRATLSTPEGVSGDPQHADDVGHPACRADLNVIYRETVA